MQTRFRLPILATLALHMPWGAFGVPLEVIYTGKLTDNAGVVIPGPVNLRVSFWNGQCTTGTTTCPGSASQTAATLLASQGGAALSPAGTFSGVPVSDAGVFSLHLYLSLADFNTVFPDSASPSWIQVEQMTNGGGVVRVFPRQRFGLVPYCLKVPVDGTSVLFDASTGELKVGAVSASSLPAMPGVSGSYTLANITVDASGRISSVSNGSVPWGSPGAIGATTPASGNFTSVSSTSFGIGTSTPAADFSFDGSKARTLQQDRNSIANATHGQALSIRAGGASSGAADKNGGTLILASGLSTGGGSSSIQFQTAASGAAGNGDNAPTTKMTILGNGMVGIGITNPTTALHVAGGIRTESGGFISNLGTSAAGVGTVHQTMRTNDGIRFGFGLMDLEGGSNTGSNYNLWRYSDTGSFLGSALTVLRSTGAVGIGNTSPSYALLEVGQNQTASPVAGIRITGGTKLGSAPTLTFNYADAAENARLSAIYPDIAGDLILSTLKDNGTPTEVMHITRSGNIGIGTSNPLHKLVVSTLPGSEVFMATDLTTGYMGTLTNQKLILQTNNVNALTIDTNRNVGIGTTTPDARLSVVDGLTSDTRVHIVNTNTNSGNVGLELRGHAKGSVQYIDFTDASTSNAGAGTPDTQHRILSTNYMMQFNTATDAIMTLRDYNVGIGTTAPQAKLNVVGTAAFQSNFAGTFPAFGGAIGNGGLVIGWNGSPTTTGETDFINFPGLGTGGFRFVLGNAAGNVTSTAVTIDGAGNVGIGTTVPGTTLDVAGSATIRNNLYVGTSGSSYNIEAASGTGNLNLRNTNANTNLNLDFPATNGALLVRKHDGTTGTEIMRVEYSGNVGIGNTAPSKKLDVGGSIRGTQGYYNNANTCILGDCPSDRRFKKNIHALEERSLDRVCRLKPVWYEWRRDEFPRLSRHSESPELGLIAQEVEEIFPEWVRTDNDGYKRIEYGTALSLHLVQAVRELRAEKEELRKTVEALTALVCEDKPHSPLCR